MAAGDREAEQRQQSRNSLFLMAACQLRDTSETCRIKVRNLSATGLMANSPLQLAVDEMIWVELRNIGWVEGRVVWVQDFQFGLTFLHEIDPLVVRNIPEPQPEVADYCVRRPLGITIARPEPPDPGKLRSV